MKLENIKKYGKRAQGKNELIRRLQGKRLSPREAILAKCYECMNGYADGKNDCGIKDCPHYPFMPFRKGEKAVLRKMSEEQKRNVGRNLPNHTATFFVIGHYNGQ